MKIAIFAVLLTACFIGCAATAKVEVETPDCPMCKVHEDGVCKKCLEVE